MENLRIISLFHFFLIEFTLLIRKLAVCIITIPLSAIGVGIVDLFITAVGVLQYYSIHI